VRWPSAQFRHVAALGDAEQHVSWRGGLERALAALAQRSDNCIARSISARSAGRRTHSSSCMAISEPSSRCTSIERSGDSSTLAPSICERNVTACSLSLRSCASDITWKPPESVSIGPASR
jgi:hypothetical protein